MVRCRSLTALTAQPTTNRENRSTITERYSLPLARAPLTQPRSAEGRQVELTGHRAPLSCLPPPPTGWPPALNSSVNCRRARLLLLVDPTLNIVSALRKVSTEADQAQGGVQCGGGFWVSSTPRRTLIHSDQGTQYGSDAWRRFCLLESP